MIPFVSPVFRGPSIRRRHPAPRQADAASRRDLLLGVHAMAYRFLTIEAGLRRAAVRLRTVRGVDLAAAPEAERLKRVFVRLKRVGAQD